MAPDPLFVVVDPRKPRRPDGLWRERLERMISEAASVVVARLEGGLPVGVVAGRRVVGPLTGMESLDALLRPLAELEALPADDGGPVVRRHIRTMVFSARDMSS